MVINGTCLVSVKNSTPQEIGEILLEKSPKHDGRGLKVVLKSDEVDLLLEVGGFESPDQALAVMLLDVLEERSIPHSYNQITRTFST